MPLRINDKQAIVKEVKAIADKATAIIAADYRGVTSADMTELRSKARQVGVKVKVVRNTLANRAFSGTAYACMSKALVGSILLAFSGDEPGAAAKLIRDFAKDHEALKVTALSLGNTLLSKEQLSRVAGLPNKSQAISQLMSVMQAPVIKLLRTMAEPHAKLVRTLAAVKDAKQA